jgi:hypothetical protein
LRMREGANHCKCCAARKTSKMKVFVHDIYI